MTFSLSAWIPYLPAVSNLTNKWPRQKASTHLDKFSYRVLSCPQTEIKSNINSEPSKIEKLTKRQILGRSNSMEDFKNFLYCRLGAEVFTTSGFFCEIVEKATVYKREKRSEPSTTATLLRKRIICIISTLIVYASF